MNITWSFKEFNDLGTGELYDILSLRNQVFVVEQSCVYLDTDGIDKESWHLCGWDSDNLVAYARIIPPGVVYPEASIGRVVSNPAHRNKGAGKLLMNRAIQAVYTQFNALGIRIGAQLYLEAFYTNLGFTRASEVYIEDGIPHIKMLHIK